MSTGSRKWYDWLAGGIPASQPPPFEVMTKAQAWVARYTVLIAARQMIQDIRAGSNLSPGSGVLAQFNDGGMHAVLTTAHILQPCRTSQVPATLTIVPPSKTNKPITGMLSLDCRSYTGDGLTSRPNTGQTLRSFP